MKKTDVINIFRKYQSSRANSTEENIQIIVSMARSKLSEENADSNRRSTDRGKEVIGEIFDIYQQQRNLNKKDGIDNIVSLARQKIRNNLRKTIIENIFSIFMPLRRLVDNLQNKIAGFRTKPGFQAAAIVLVFITITSALMFQTDGRNYLEKNHAYHKPPEELIAYSSELSAEILQTLPTASFGFSDTTDQSTVAFQLGVMMTDLYILSAAGETEAVTELTGRFKQVLSRAKLSQKPPILTEESGFSPEQVQISTRVLEQQFLTTEQTKMYRLGQWLEATLLVTGIVDSDSGNPQLLAELLTQWKKEQIKSPLKLSPPVARLIADLNTLTAIEELSFGETQNIHQKIRQIKAVLQQ